MTNQTTREMHPPPNDLKKLTVPQLKAICKERQLTGYSKLSKAALLLKLSESSQTQPSAAGTISSQVTVPSNEPIELKKSKKTVEKPLRFHSPVALDQNSRAGQAIPPNDHALSVSESFPDTPPVNIDRLQSLSTHSTATEDNPTFLASSTPSSGQSIAHEPSTPTTISAVLPGRQVDTNAVIEDRTVANNKRPGLPVSTIAPFKKLKYTAVSTTVDISSSSAGNFDGPHISSAVPEGRPAAMGNTLRSAMSPPNLSMPTKGTKFKPLKSSLLPTSANYSRAPPVSALPPVRASESVSLYHLDFPLSSPLLLRPITLPPSLLQRKRLPRWSIILSGIFEEDIVSCIQVSRMFRYAGRHFSPFTPYYYIKHRTNSLRFSRSSARKKFWWSPSSYR
jgi:hypothetical protein